MYNECHYYFFVYLVGNSQKDIYRIFTRMQIYFICAIVNPYNLNNTFQIGNLTVNSTLKAMIIEIFIIAVTFLVTSNANGSDAFAQDGNNILGCAHTVKVTISHLPKQTADSSTQVALFNITPSDDRGEANITIPGIGDGLVVVKFHIASDRTYKASISNIPGQTGESDNGDMPEGYVCGQSIHPLSTIGIPGIGSGYITMTKVN
jgi:hypothetical protein